MVVMRPTISFIVVSVDSMCEPIAGSTASCPSMRFTGPETLRFITKITTQNLNLY
jgi:hypothetical protein